MVELIPSGIRVSTGVQDIWTEGPKAIVFARRSKDEIYKAIPDLLMKDHRDADSLIMNL